MLDDTVADDLSNDQLQRLYSRTVRSRRNLLHTVNTVEDPDTRRRAQFDLKEAEARYYRFSALMSKSGLL